MIEMLKNVPKRVTNSFIYCRDALVLMFTKEESFRLETLGLAILVFILCLVDWPLWKIMAMIAAYLLIPLMEVVNTAIEDVCDLFTKEPNTIVKHAKDKGALAVLFAIIINALVLVTLILM